MTVSDKERRATSAPDPSDLRAGSRGLTGRQGRILELLALGLETKEMAWSLGISESAVKTNVARLKDRYGAPNRTVVVLVAIRLGELAVTPDGRSTRRIEGNGCS